MSKILTSFKVYSMKTEIGALNCLYPMPTTLIGAMVKGRPNYVTIAHVGIMDHKSISLSMAKIHYTNTGIKEYGTFSINIPSANMVEKTDYCGLVSGKDKDKSSLFKTFYGELKTAPMVEECPINMECKLVKTVDFPKHDIFIEEIKAAYCDDTLLKNDTIELGKVDPILFVMSDRSYWRLGEKFAAAWQVGKHLKQK
jgi:flavin reductase (DIM6/NTAB) family NADH-FMN oxidoreductase RutF